MKIETKPLLTVLIGFSLGTAGFTKALPAARRQIARGNYLVNQVAKCGDCHSPHNARGQVPPGHKLAGGRLDFQPAHPVPGWTAVTPSLRGLPTVTLHQAMQLLTRAKDKTGKPPAPPMPEYHMKRADAAAIIAYLKSLPPEGK